MRLTECSADLPLMKDVKRSGEGMYYFQTVGNSIARFLTEDLVSHANGVV